MDHWLDETRHSLAERAQMVRKILAEGVLRVRASNPHPHPSPALAFTLARETPRLNQVRSFFALGIQSKRYADFAVGSTAWPCREA